MLERSPVGIILVVDDQESVRVMVRRQLTDRGADVRDVLKDRDAEDRVERPGRERQGASIRRREARADGCRRET